MGLGDFFSGVGEAIGGGVADVVGAGVDIAEDAVGAAKNVAKAGAWGVTHIDDAVEGVAEYGGEMVKGAAWLAQNPGYWDDAAKAMVIDQFTDPVNIATNIGMLGLTIATGGAAAPAWAAKIGLGTKGLLTAARAGKTADTISDVAKATRTISNVAEAGQKASRMQRFSEGATRFAGRLDELQNKPTEMIQGARKAFTGKLEDVTGGMFKQRELSYIQSGRKKLATRAFGEVEDLKTAEGVVGGAKRLGYRATAGGAQKSELIGAGTFGELNWRANRTAAQVTGVRDLRENMQVTADITQAIAHPEQAGKELAQAAWHEYGDEATRLAAKKLPGAAKKGLKGDKDKAEDDIYSPYEMAEPEQIKLMEFRLDGTRNTRTSRRQPGAVTALGTTTTNTTMPSHVGPSDWYGPQGGYSAGRGFKQQQALPPLTQPGSPLAV